MRKIFATILAMIDEQAGFRSSSSFSVRHSSGALMTIKALILLP
jgi:hypothetical protein